MYTKPSDPIGRSARQSDTDLLAQIADGDREAMHVLYQRHHDALYGFVRARIDGRDAAKAFSALTRFLRAKLDD